MTDRVDGLTAEEGAVMDGLAVAVDAFAALPRQHPDELRDFVDGIHRCQYLLALRVARRHHPIGWPVKDDAAFQAERAKLAATMLTEILEDVAIVMVAADDDRDELRRKIGGLREFLTR